MKFEFHTLPPEPVFKPLGELWPTAKIGDAFINKGGNVVFIKQTGKNADEVIKFVLIPNYDAHVQIDNLSYFNSSEWRPCEVTLKVVVR